MFKLLCITAIHERDPQILLNCMKKFGIETIAAVTHDKDYGIDTIRTMNEPLGHKWNRVATMALKYDWTHLLIMGDDNAITEKGLARIKENAWMPLGGFPSVTYAHPLTQRACEHWIDFDIPKVIGAGRFINRKTLEDVCVKYRCRVVNKEYAEVIGITEDITLLSQSQMEYLTKIGGIIEPIDKVVELFPPSASKRLDFQSDNIFAKYNYLYTQIHVGSEPPVLDIKSGFNLWGYNQVVAGKLEADYHESLKRFNLCHDQISTIYGNLPQ